VAVAAASPLSPRERGSVDALALWVAGRGNDAIPLIRALLAEHPRDMLLLQRLYFIHFWQGRSAAMLELTDSTRGAFTDDSFMLGLHAFSLEENGRYAEALPLAERAMALNPRDAWAVHAAAPVFYETGENERGVEALPPRIHPCDHLGYFRNHLLWHLALMHLATGRYERAAALFQSVFGRIAITVGSDLQDSVARAAGGEWTHAELQLERLRARAKKTRNATLPEVVVPLLEGLHAFARGEHAEAVARIAPIEARIVEVGGSHAQREVFHDTLLVAALRAKDVERSQALLRRRLAKRPNPGHYWSQR